jgi:signal transduction histidine kinase
MEQRCSFLGAASRELAATLDYEKTVAGIAGRPLPHLGAWCIVDLMEQEGALRRVAILHPDPEKRGRVEELRSGWPPARTDPFGIPSVIASGEPEVVARVDDDLLVRYAGDTANLRILRELRVGSLVTVPMAARGLVIGAITYVADTADAFSDADVALAQDLAALSALAVLNARTHQSAERAYRAAEAQRQEARHFASLAARLNEQLLVSAVHEMEAAELSASLEESKAALMASLAHDLRSPLSAILGYTELLLGGQLGGLSERQAASLTRVTVAVHQILRLVDQILLRARLDARREPLELGSVDIAAVSRESLELIRPLADKKGLTLLCDIADEPLSLSTDCDKVRQILLNLLSNAIKFTDGGEVRLTVRSYPEGVEWLVSDTGCGIPAEEQEHVFDRFTQTGDGTRRGGSGLGLAITRALLDLLGGSIHLESAPGRGSTFTVRLPWMPAASSPPPLPQVERPS